MLSGSKPTVRFKQIVATTRKLTMILLISSVAARAFAADAVPLNVQTSSRSGLPSYVTPQNQDIIPVAATVPLAQPRPIDFFIQYGSIFDVTDADRQLVLSRTQTDGLGQTHTTFTQVHNGISVFSGVLKVHQNPNGEFIAANGKFYPLSPKLDTTPAIDTATAIQSTLDDLGSGTAQSVQSELVIVDPGWYGDSPMGARLAYYIIMQDIPARMLEAFFVDAHSGEILDRWTMLHTIKNREIHDANGSASLPGPIVRIEGQGPTGDFDTNAAYDYYGDTYDYYLRAFGRDSINGLGMKMVATIDSTAPTCPNAFWSSALLQMVFCAGTVTDDVVGHELTHGVTQFTAGLIYQNQSGQLNESFSDVFGELIDLFNGNVAFPGPPSPPFWPTHPTGPGLDTPNNLRTTCSAPPSYPNGVRWLIGDDATAFGGAIRDMWNPPCEGDPDDANSTLQTCNSLDSGGVHSGSGVANHAFAIVTDGKTFNGHTVTGIGPIKSGAVWYRALSVYLTPASDFEDAYTAFNLAANDLIGTFPNDPRTGAPSASVFTAFDATQVNEALLAVEMNTTGACGASEFLLVSTPPFVCPNGPTIFEDNFESGTNGWTVSNSNPPTPYNWVQTSGGLPFGRGGTVWLGEDRSVGDCSSVVEAATHSLTSPIINIPAGVNRPLISFTHYLASEPSWDGGNIRISVNGGAFQLIPRTAIIYNPYNGRLKSVAQGNDNPFAGQEAWTGAGGQWGTSIINLQGLVSGGNTLRVRFDFSKDGCTGITGWYVDDFRVYRCLDCDADNIPDDREFSFSASSPSLGNIGSGSPQSYSVTAPPVAASDVKMIFSAAGDFSSSTEYVNVSINGTPVGTVFQNGAGDCPGTPDSEILVIPAATFNAAVSGGNANVSLTATGDVSATACDGITYIAFAINYEVNASDSDDDGILNSCDNCPSTPNTDQANSDGDTAGNVCDGCPNDPNKTVVGICGCGVADVDTDEDGTADCIDGCPSDPNKIAPGICGCGVADVDTDGDETPDCNDQCPNDPNKIEPGTCGCGLVDAPADGDMDADSDTDGDDIQIFVDALTGGSPTQSDICHGNFDGQNGLDFADVPGMVSALLGP